MLDLNVFPWPWDENSVDQIFALDILEHVDDLVAVMDEAQRVMQPGGVMYIRGPSPDFIWDDVTHKRAFKLVSFDHFDRSTFLGTKYEYGNDPGWRVASKSQNQSIIMFTLFAQPEEVIEPEVFEDFEPIKETFTVTGIEDAKPD